MMTQILLDTNGYIDSWLSTQFVIVVYLKNMNDQFVITQSGNLLSQRIQARGHVEDGDGDIHS
jgi:hypothetical protein